MTDAFGFENAFVRFRAMPYPEYPKQEELQDWNSALLTVDGHIAGYASRVYNGGMRAREVPDLAGLVLRIESLRASLDAIHTKSHEEHWLIGEYRSYVSALELMTRELDWLARQEK